MELIPLQQAAEEAPADPMTLVVGAFAVIGAVAVYDWVRAYGGRDPGPVTQWALASGIARRADHDDPVTIDVEIEADRVPSPEDVRGLATPHQDDVEDDDQDDVEDDQSGVVV